MLRYGAGALRPLAHFARKNGRPGQWRCKQAFDVWDRKESNDYLFQRTQSPKFNCPRGFITRCFGEIEKRAKRGVVIAGAGLDLSSQTDPLMVIVTPVRDEWMTDVGKAVQQQRSA